jgi:hypothetical protein
MRGAAARGARIGDDLADQRERSAGSGPSSIQWNESNIKTSYSNVCNVTGTREEITLLFGIGKTLQGDPVLRVDLSDRIILSPFAAKRLATLLNNVLSTYEERFGPLAGEPQVPLTTTKN